MPPKKLVIDCDPGNDDAMAILMALADVNCDIIAITCVAGNCDVTQASLNALRTLKVANRLDVSLTLYLNYIYINKCFIKGCPPNVKNIHFKM